MKKQYFAFLLICFVCASCNITIIEANNNYNKVLDLTGSWKFNIGDNMEWATVAYNDSSWESIYTPSNWEKQGYIAYDGIAWYRKSIKRPEIAKNQSLYIYIRNIDDADELYYNGHLIGSTGKFPPQYVTGYGWERRYLIPKKYWSASGNDIIAVRVYDDSREGGLIDHDICLETSNFDSYLDLNLSGSWKFILGDIKACRYPNFNEDEMKTISVPASWESQGYFNYDGYAWYRKTFDMPSSLINNKLYLVLGRIDDYDRVFLNGEWIGEVSSTRIESEVSNRYGQEYRTWRVYEIPSKILKDGENVISIKVFDISGIGGIYEGPIGIMTKDNMKQFKDEIKHNNSIFTEGGLFNWNVFGNNDSF